MKKLLSRLWIFLLIATVVAGQESKFSTLVFYEYLYTTDKNASPNNAFELQRVYFTYEKAISNKIAYKFQTDVFREPSGRLEVFLKNAKADWKSPIGKISLGQQGMNMFPVQENNWGLRFMEKMPMDRYKFASSADMGIGWSGKLKGKTTVSALITNGGGYKEVERDTFKKISLQGYVGPKNLTKEAGFNAGGVLSFEPFEDQNTGETETSLVGGLFAGAATSSWRAGAELNVKSISNTSAAEILAAAYGTIHTPFGGLIARADIYSNAGDTETSIILGLLKKVHRGLLIAPNIRAHADGTYSVRLNFQFKS